MRWEGVLPMRHHFTTARFIFLCADRKFTASGESTGWAVKACRRAISAEGLGSQSGPEERVAAGAASMAAALAQPCAAPCTASLPTLFSPPHSASLPAPLKAPCVAVLKAPCVAVLRAFCTV